VARVLFGAEIVAELETLVDAMFDIETTGAELVDLPHSAERSEQVRKRRERLNKVEDVQIRLPDLFSRYMRMDMKVARPLW
jgi:hypothetical protein